MWSLGGLPPTLGFPTAMDLQQGAAPPWTRCRCLQAGLRMHLSPDLRFQLFLFLLSLTACSRGWDPGSHPESALDNLAQIRTQNFIFPVPPQKWNLLLILGQFINYCRAPALYQALMPHSRNTPMTQVNTYSVGA